MGRAGVHRPIYPISSALTASVTQQSDGTIPWYSSCRSQHPRRSHRLCVVVVWSSSALSPWSFFSSFSYLSLEMPRNKELARHKARRRNSSFSVFFVFVVAHFFRCFRRIDGPSGRWRSAPSSPPAAGQPPAQPCRATRQGRTLCANRGDVPRRRAPRQPADRPSARAARPRAPSSPSITGTVDQRACGRPRRGSERRPPHWA